MCLPGFPEMNMHIEQAGYNYFPGHIVLFDFPNMLPYDTHFVYNSADNQYIEPPVYILGWS
jgi:hypothetical protein